MKVTTWIVVALALIVLLYIGMRSGDEPSIPEVTLHSVSPDVVSTSPPAVDDTEPAQPAGASDGYVLYEADRALAETIETESEEPPRTVAGLPAIKRSEKLPIIDPDTLPFEPNAGRVDPSSQAGTGSNPASSDDAMFVPVTEGNERGGGPLAGKTPRPDPDAPGPSGHIGANSGGAHPNLGGVYDPMGPGRPIDADTADAAPPMFRLPGEDVIIADPDESPE